MPITLRPYQRDILNSPDMVAILKYITGKLVERPKFMAPLLVAPTGAGKTAMFAAISAWCRDRGLRVMVLVPRKEILRQTVKAMNTAGVIPGQIASGRPMTGDLVQVASIQTVVNRLGTCRKPDIIICDEAHHSTLQGSIGKIMGFWGSVPRIGVTATPARLDGVGLRAMFDTLILGPTLKELVDDGYLAYPFVLQPPGAEGADSYHVTRGDFDKGEQAAAMVQGAIVGHVIEHYRKYLDGAPSIYSCVNIEHAQLMADQFRQAGYTAEAVWGDMPDEDRDRALGGLGDGRVSVVTFCDLIGEGVDIPAVSGVGLLRKTMSLALCRQIIGRGLRPVYAEGADLATREGRLAGIAAGPKPRAIILDHVGNTTSTWGHGHPLIEPIWSLDSERRKKGELPPVTVTCPKCYGVWPGRPQKCPACGWSFSGADMAAKHAELVELEGELVEAGIPPDEAEGLAGFLQRALAAEKKQRAKMILAKAYELAGAHEDEETRKRKIDELAKAVSYKPGWTAWFWEQRQRRSS
jgi:superfamily II DNA or RNA helicase